MMSVLYESLDSLLSSPKSCREEADACKRADHCPAHRCRGKTVLGKFLLSLFEVYGSGLPDLCIYPLAVLWVITVWKKCYDFVALGWQALLLYQSSIARIYRNLQTKPPSTVGLS